MKRRIPLSFILLALGFVVALWLVFLSQRNQSAPLPQLASFSSQPDGAKALRLWLQAQGYQVLQSSHQKYQIPEKAQLVFVLQPSERFTDQESEALLEWVRAGGNLFLVFDQWLLQPDGFLQELEVELLIGGGNVSPTLPLYFPPHPPTNWQALRFLKTSRPDAQVLLQSDAGAVALLIPEGTGKVLITSLSQPFENSALSQAGNAELCLSLIFALLPTPAPLWFDDYHHGQHSIAPEGFFNALLGTAPGQALLLALLIGMFALWWSGRPFGRQLPLPNSRKPRAPMEHITALANLYRRAGKRNAIAGQYAYQLKHALGRRFSLSPALSDTEWLKELQNISQNVVDSGALAQTLALLRKPNLSETELLAASQQVSYLIEQASRTRSLPY